MTIDRKAFSNPKISLIIECTVRIMRDRGDKGLTMRQVASSAGMSLSNLQYYFKNKDELLSGMVDFYLDQCAAALDEHIATSNAKNLREKLHGFIAFSLKYGENLTEVCKVFRELWAIATRNEDVNRQLEQYYAIHVEKLSAMIASETTNLDAVPKAVSIIIPYIEGYTITAPAMPVNMLELADILTNTVMHILAAPAKQQN